MRKYGTYKSKVGHRDVKHLEAQNGLYKAIILIGISREEGILDVLDSDSRYTQIMKEYNKNPNSKSYCNKGKRFICNIMSINDEKISKRKARYYLFKENGGMYYVDIMITHFAKAIFQEINNDEALLKALGMVLKRECNDFSVADDPTASDCVSHIFGFQYEVLKDIVDERYDITRKNSKKTFALKKCFEEMGTIVLAVGYPKCS